MFGTELLLLTLALVSSTVQIHQGVQAERQARESGRALERQGEQVRAERRREARRLIARQRVALAASGVDPAGSGPVDLLSDTAATEELAALRAGFPFFSEARNVRFQGEQQRNAAIVSGITSILGAGMSAGGGGGMGMGQQSGTSSAFGGSF